MQVQQNDAELQLQHAAALAGSLNPYKVLARGYAMVTTANGAILDAEGLQRKKQNICSQRFSPGKMPGRSGGGD